MTVDVLVVGGGSAGLAAAVTAARQGGAVALVERHGVLGGMGTASLVHSFCGLYRLGRDQPELANPGMPGEIEQRMRRRSGIDPVRMGKVWVLPQHPVDFVRIADELVEESGVETRYHSELIGIERRGAGWLAELVCRGRREAVAAAALVDASGDAVVADLLGAESKLSEPARLQRPAYVFGVNGVAGELPPLVIGAAIVAGVREGDLPEAARGLHFRTSGRPGEVFGTLDLSGEEAGAGYDPTDPRCLAALEGRGREVAERVTAFLRERQEGWAAAYISHWPMRAGVRESRRWLGRAVLSGAELMAGARHDDDIAAVSWPMEFRETPRGPKLRFPESGRVAGIPFAALTPRAGGGLFVAGRCLSCDHDAQASIRVMGTCFATGQAAGLAAARAAAGEDPAATPAALAAAFGPVPGLAD